MFNPVIIIAIIAQAIIGKFSRIAGAVIGYILTTGILIWGITVYMEGYQMAFFGIALPFKVFCFGCLFWYLMDTKEFKAAKKQTKELLPETLICQNCGKAITLNQNERIEGKFICPECNETNDYNNDELVSGDESENTHSDLRLVNCYHCKKNENVSRDVPGILENFLLIFLIIYLIVISPCFVLLSMFKFEKIEYSTFNISNLMFFLIYIPFLIYLQVLGISIGLNLWKKKNIFHRFRFCGISIGKVLWEKKEVFSRSRLFFILSLVFSFIMFVCFRIMNEYQTELIFKIVIGNFAFTFFTSIIWLLLIIIIKRKYYKDFEK